MATHEFEPRPSSARLASSIARRYRHGQPTTRWSAIPSSGGRGRREEKEKAMSSPNLYHRVIARCACCGHEYTEAPATARRTRDGDTTYLWWDCECGSGQVAVQDDGLVLTVPETNSYFAKAGVGVSK